MNFDKIKVLEISPKELDSQSPVVIDRWVDIDSQECKELDDDRKTTLMMMKSGIEGDYMMVDKDGRVFVKSPEESTYFPLHFEWRKKELIGYRITKKALN